MITQHGPICDVCGDYILLEGIETFSTDAFNNHFICHVEKCKPGLAEMKLWTELPPGPLRSAYERLAEADDSWNRPRAAQEVSDE